MRGGGGNGRIQGFQRHRPLLTLGSWAQAGTPELAQEIVPSQGAQQTQNRSRLTPEVRASSSMCSDSRTPVSPGRCRVLQVKAFELNVGVTGKLAPDS